MNKKAAILVISSLSFFITFTTNSIYSQNTFFEWNGKVVSKDGGELSYTHIQVKSKDHFYLFMSDDNGYVEIQYPDFSETDSVYISCIGFKSIKTSSLKLKELNEIILDTESYEIGEAVITARKKKKNKRLGNLHNTTIRCTQIGFNGMRGLYIPNTGLNGKIVAVRVYMHDFFEKDWKYRPFKVRIFEGNYPFEKELINEEIIASLAPKKNHWVEIDLSNFNIVLPQDGVMVAIGALPFEYYKENGYIQHEKLKGIDNSISIGTTVLRSSKNKIKSWRYYSSRTGWKEVNDDWYYLIQIKVQYE